MTWRPYNERGARGWVVLDEDGRNILERMSGDRARLFAAAPELLEACEAMAKAYGEHDWSDYGVSNALYDAMECARAAIAKARGGH